MNRAAQVWTCTTALLAAMLSACRGTEIEDAIGKVSWFSNMRDQAAVEPYEEAPLVPPEGAVAVDAGVPLGTFPTDYETVGNPTQPDTASLERGRELFEIFCSVCHGPEGQGGGNVEGPFPRGLIPELTTDQARELSDGYLFGIISTGRGLMPNYRRIAQADRWLIVNYVRELQRAGRSGG